MTDKAKISPRIGRGNYKIDDLTIILSIVSILICTFLRASLFLIYPLVTLLIAAYFRLKISSSFIILLTLAMISLITSLFGDAFIRYKLLSIFYMLPFLLLLFSDPTPAKENQPDYLSSFIKTITVITVINDLIGFVQILMNPVSDDSFIGIYSQFSVSLNGLMLINIFLFFYYLFDFMYIRRFKQLAFSLFFLICAMLGFYGAGLFICLAAFILSFFQSSARSLIKTLLIGILSLSAVFLTLLMIKPLVLEYNIANIKKLSTFDINSGPRKIRSFYNYGTSYPRNPKDFLLGSGPGTFNSRTAFMVGSPSYFTALPIIKDHDQPYYFKQYAYPLWNETNTIQSLYLDGFRNQPFSSMLSILGEYGLLFFLAFFFLYYYYYYSVAKLYRKINKFPEAQLAFRFFKLLIILLPLLLLIDNYYEYPEIMLLILLGIKFSHIKLMTINQHSRNAIYQKTKF